MFGAAFLQLLQVKNKTQNQISKTAGIDEATISRFLTGEKAPSYHHILTISDALGVDPVVFFPTAKCALTREGDCKSCTHKVQLVIHKYGTIYTVNIDDQNEMGIYKNLFMTDTGVMSLKSGVMHYDKTASHRMFRVIKGQMIMFYEHGKRVLTNNDSYKMKGYETHIQAAAGTVADTVIIGAGYNNYFETMQAVCS